MAKIVTGVVDCDADALFTLMADISIDEFTREAAFGAATFLAWEGRIDRDRMKQFLLRFYEERLAEDGDQAWAGWLQAIALLGMRDLVPLVDLAWREDRLPELWIDRPELDEDLARAERSPDDVARFTERNLGYIEDVLESLAWTRGVQNDGFEEDDETSFWADDPYPNEPVRNPWRHVGRNRVPAAAGRRPRNACLANGEPPM